MNETGIASGGWGGQFHNQSFHAKQHIVLNVYYHNDHLAKDRKAYREPVHHNSSELLSHIYLPGATLAGGVAHVKTALKTSSTLFSIEELQKRPVSGKAQQRSFLHLYRSAKRANFSRSYGATCKAWAQQRSIHPLR